MRTKKLIFRFCFATILVLSACSKPGSKQDKQGRTDTTVYVLNTFPSQEKEFFKSYSEKDILDFLYFSGAHGKKIKDTTYIVDVSFTKFPPEWETAEDTALIVYVLLSKENVRNHEDLSEGLIGYIMLRMTGGQLEVVMDTTVTERRGPVVSRAEEEGYETAEDAFPVSPALLKIPANAGSQISIYHRFSEKDVFEYLYGNNQVEVTDNTVFQVVDYEILTGDLAALKENGKMGATDSSIILLVTYAPCDPDLEECTQQYCDLVILSAAADTLSVVAKKVFGPYENFMEGGGGGREEKLGLELYRVNDYASAVGLHYTYSEGTDLSGGGSEGLELYIVGVNDKMILPVLNLDMGESNYENDYDGPEGGSSSSSVYKSDIGITDEVSNGFYKIIHSTIHREYENGQVTYEESSSVTYAWDTDSFVPRQE